MKCASTEQVESRTEMFQWVPRVGMFFGLIGMLITRKRLKYALPVCDHCYAIWKRSRFVPQALAALFVLPGMGMIAFGVGYARDRMVQIGGLVCILSLFVVVIAQWAVRPKTVWAAKIDDQFIYLDGVHPRVTAAICQRR